MRGGAVVWKFKLQTVVTDSTCEAEYVGAAAEKENMWVRTFMAEMTGRVQRIPFFGNNQSALALMRQHTPGAAGSTKHTDVVF